MYARNVNLATVLLFSAITLGGCGASPPPRTGFLTDYSNLQRYSDTSFRYSASNDVLQRYDRFIVDPVVVYYHGDPGKATRQRLDDLAVYFRGKIIEAIDDSYPVARSPGPNVARIRIALTDVQKSTWWKSLHPAMKLTGRGTGQAAMEGEVVDSLTGAQIAALVESQRGSQFELDTFSEYDDAHDVIDVWAQRFRERLDGIHGR